MLSFTFLVNTVVVYWLQDRPRVLIAGAIESETFWVLFSLANVVAMGAMLWRLPGEASSAAEDTREPAAEEELRELSPVPPTL